jgi:hypothetical protein
LVISKCPAKETNFFLISALKPSITMEAISIEAVPIAMLNVTILCIEIEKVTWIPFLIRFRTSVIKQIDEEASIHIPTVNTLVQKQRVF